MDDDDKESQIAFEVARELWEEADESIFQEVVRVLEETDVTADQLEALSRDLRIYKDTFAQMDPEDITLEEMERRLPNNLYLKAFRAYSKYVSSLSKEERQMGVNELKQEFRDRFNRKLGGTEIN